MISTFGQRGPEFSPVTNTSENDVLKSPLLFPHPLELHICSAAPALSSQHPMLPDTDTEQHNILLSDFLLNYAVLGLELSPIYFVSPMRGSALNLVAA